MTTKQALPLAVLSVIGAVVCARYHYPGLAIIAVTATVVLVVWPICLRYGEAGREQWKTLRQEGALRFVLLRGVLFMGCLLPAWSASLDYFSAGHLELMRSLRMVVAGVLLGSLACLWEWRARERKYSQKYSQHEGW